MIVIIYIKFITIANIIVNCDKFENFSNLSQEY